jgi:hypothetical protein
MRNSKARLVATLFLGLNALGFGALGLNTAAFAQAPLRIQPYQTWLQSITILGNESGTLGLGAGGIHPFSAIEESTYSHKPDEHTLEPRSKLTTYIYLDRYGRTRAERHVTSYIGGEEKSWLASIYIADPLAGVLYRLDSTNRTATREAWGLAAREAALDRDHEYLTQHSTAVMEEVVSHVDTQYMGHTTRDGLVVDSWKQSLSVPAGTEGNERAYDIVVESWTSRKLKVMVFSRRDLGTTRRETRLTHINLSEPDETLFRVPADYKIEDAPNPDSFVVGGVTP